MHTINGGQRRPCELGLRLRNIIAPTTGSKPNPTGSGTGVNTIELTLSPGIE
jgi:hypothetical protein